MSRRHRASCPSKNRQKKNAVERFHSVFLLLVRVTGLEPARRGHQNLNLARLPIPPYPRVRLVYPFCGYLSILMMVLIGSGALAKRKEFAYPAGAQEGRHQGFYPLVNHPFPIIARRKSESGDRFEIGERQRIFPLLRTDLLRVRPFLLLIRSAGYRTATHAVSSAQARHTRVAQFVSGLL